MKRFPLCQRQMAKLDAISGVEKCHMIRSYLEKIRVFGPVDFGIAMRRKI